MKAKLILTDSCFGLFTILNRELVGKTQGLKGRNLVFCEEKLTLMTERSICGEFGGSFNTAVYSFGNYLRAKKRLGKTLSREGSAMAVKRVLEKTTLKCFTSAKKDLAPTLFEVIAQLKSAKITPEDLTRAADGSNGILSEKLRDIATVFSAYEEYIVSKGLSDQSTALSYLPEVIKTDAETSDSDVFIVGYAGFTGQMRAIIAELLKNAKSVTAILTGGKNPFAFVNETADSFKNICASVGVKYEESFVNSDYSVGGKIVTEGLFDPAFKFCGQKQKYYLFAAPNVYAETERVAEIIKRKVLDGKARYRDFTVILPNGSAYAEQVRKSFRLIDVPFFLDEKRRPENFPIVSLVYSYIDVFAKGYTPANLSAFYKNPYVCGDTAFIDEFENFVYKYGLFYDKFRKPFPTVDCDPAKFAKFQEFRAEICALLTEFDVFVLLDKLNAEEKTERFSDDLLAIGETEDSAVLLQTYKKIKDILSEMDDILTEEKYSVADFKAVFKSGVSAMKISVIPQYNDAVFIGDFKQGALAKAKYLFVLGLTDEVPQTKSDVAMLSDSDIDALKEIKLLVEPKINVVNKRFREETALGFSAYSDELYLSYPVSDFAGDKTVKSDIIDFFRENFGEPSEFPGFDGYLTAKEGARTFAKDCSRFAKVGLDNFNKQSGFYLVTGETCAKTVERANRTEKIRLDGCGDALTSFVDSPTAIEDFYKCPFMAFLSRVLNVKERDTGELDNLSVGTLAHELLAGFSRELYRVKSTDDVKKVFSEVAERALKKDAYRIFDQGKDSFGVELAIKECEKYCHKIYEWSKISRFALKRENVEAAFGEGKKYPPISLAGGKVKIKGKIDRIDVSGDDIRIMDYKTSGKGFDDAKYYMGSKIQLFLYSLAFPEKNLAGAYYLAVNDEYKSKNGRDKTFFADGKTLDSKDGLAAGEEKFVSAKDGIVSREEMRALRDYAEIISEKATENLSDGVIVASPTENACEFCAFSAICGKPFDARAVDKIDVPFIAEAVKNYKETKGEN